MSENPAATTSPAPSLSRRKALAAAAGVTTTALAAPAIAQGVRQWRMVTSWPKGLPGLGTGAERVARRIESLSDGRIRIQVYAAGELVPGLEVFDAVSNGTAQIGHDAAYYHLNKTQAAPFFTSVPFGMVAQELAGWIHWGGGQELWDEAYAPFNLKPFLSGNTGTQMGGWFREEVESLDDLQNLKIRMPGQGGQVLRKLGATVVLLSGDQIFPSLQSGAIDAAEWVGPYNDLALGFHQVAKFYYYPGFHEPGAGLECIVNKETYDALPADLQQIVKVAAEAENDIMLAEYMSRSAAALRALVQDHGVQLRQYPREVLVALGNASGEVIEEVLDTGDAITKRTAESFLAARRDAMRLTRIGEQAMVNARLLRYDYPG